MAQRSIEPVAGNVTETLKSLMATGRRGRFNEADAMLQKFLENGQALGMIRFHGDREQQKRHRNNTASSLKNTLHKANVKDRVWVRKIPGRFDVLLLIDLEHPDCTDEIRLERKQELAAAQNAFGNGEQK